MKIEELQEIITRIKREYPEFGYIKIKLFFKENRFIAYEYENSEAKLIMKEDS